MTEYTPRSDAKEFLEIPLDDDEYMDSREWFKDSLAIISANFYELYSSEDTTPYAQVPEVLYKETNPFRVGINNVLGRPNVINGWALYEHDHYSNHDKDGFTTLAVADDGRLVSLHKAHSHYGNGATKARVTEGSCVYITEFKRAEKVLNRIIRRMNRYLGDNLIIPISR